MTASEVFADNVKVYAKAHDVMLRDIETGSGVYAGYLSRVRKRNAYVSIDNAVKMANYLQLPLETLLDPQFPEKVRQVSIKRRIKELEAEKTRLLLELGVAVHE
jgi:transcriptional regulator with XRE-family HTH domain